MSTTLYYPASRLTYRNDWWYATNPSAYPPEYCLDSDTDIQYPFKISNFSTTADGEGGNIWWYWDTDFKTYFGTNGYAKSAILHFVVDSSNFPLPSPGSTIPQLHITVAQMPLSSDVISVTGDVPWLVTDGGDWELVVGSSSSDGNIWDITYDLLDICEGHLPLVEMGIVSGSNGMEECEYHILAVYLEVDWEYNHGVTVVQHNPNGSGVDPLPVFSPDAFNSDTGQWKVPASSAPVYYRGRKENGSSTSVYYVATEHH